MTTSSKSVPSVKLSNGVAQPLIGYGTFLASDPVQLRTGLRAAVDAGYRYIDTAFVYGNEAVIGDFLQEIYKEGKLKREDFFIVTKLPFHTHEAILAEKTIRGQLEKLKTDYLDLYLMHNSCGIKVVLILCKLAKLLPKAPIF
ncbi:aldo/keto reductase family domain-containing protein [Ditylenchus destructor]|uniref:Aldo/keto reductase family domain-containing protein n=1 Tax=Ditylenchus destructor TaxID=166010 RepID=A0AAD4R7A6_9BILA|nr:aldo/keto reductase family domain-containing protein [Ditylenchus destructor]